MQISAFDAHDGIEGGVAILFRRIGVKDRSKGGAFFWDCFEKLAK